MNNNNNNNTNTAQVGVSEGGNLPGQNTTAACSGGSNYNGHSPSSVSSLAFSCDSSRAIINSTAVLISCTLSSFALLMLSTLRSFTAQFVIRCVVVKVKRYRYAICIAPRVKCSTSEALSVDHTALYTAITWLWYWQNKLTTTKINTKNPKIYTRNPKNKT